MTRGQIPASEIKLDSGELKRRLGEDYAKALEKYDGTVKEILSATTVRYSIGESSVSADAGTARIGNTVIRSRALPKHLSGYKNCAAVALTLGVDADRLIRRYTAKGQTLGFIADALLSVIADSACITVCESDVTGNHTAPFAVGYADTDTSSLPSLLRIADPQGSLGITFTDENLMIPTKSIVVIVGKM